MTQRQVHSDIRLRTHGLACGRGDAVLADNIALDLKPGSGLVLRGPNGAGKSTLLLTLAGLLPALDGTVDLDGHDPDDGAAIHYCGHRNAVRARLSALDNLQFWIALNGASGISAAEALARVGLARAAALDAGYLSAGQTRRLALARLLVSRRPIWLLDEPTAALDADGQALLAELLTEHLTDRGIAVIASHDPLAVEGLEILQMGGKP